MAKKKEVSVEERLRALYDLQLIDSRVDEIRNVRGELPLEVRDLEDEVELKKMIPRRFAIRLKDVQRFGWAQRQHQSWCADRGAGEQQLPAKRRSATIQRLRRRTRR